MDWFQNRRRNFKDDFISSCFDFSSYIGFSRILFSIFYIFSNFRLDTGIFSLALYHEGREIRGICFAQGEDKGICFVRENVLNVLSIYVIVILLFFYCCGFVLVTMKLVKSLGPGVKSNKNWILHILYILLSISNQNVPSSCHPVMIQ
jgi:hypothetical protein